ncbi:MAG TPA: gliding motility lipoprotein GldH [Puia sp.]|nr:gliding motility lipoprotein GldH [Puia sp.]
MKKLLLLLFAASCLQWTACSLPSDVFEKDITLPRQQWESNFRPTISFDISPEDTANLYNVYLVLRHTDAYNYNNIWIRGIIKQPGDTLARSDRYDLLLATNDKGWLGTGMEDIYEQRVSIQQSTKFNQPGAYSFTLEQVMREDPLKHVMNVGVRIERIP